MAKRALGAAVDSLSEAIDKLLDYVKERRALKMALLPLVVIFCAYGVGYFAGRLLRLFL